MSAPECPKCGMGNIIGPRYEHKPHSITGERLRYVCATCGYSFTTPTLDAHEQRGRRGALTPRSGSR